MKILGIETSCDETALAVIEASGGFRAPHFKILENLVASQVAIHAPFGGVVPNLAKREHHRALRFLYSKIKKTARGSDAIAVTVGPGLEPCLWEGITFAQSLIAGPKKPVIAVNHMEGHLASVLLGNSEEIRFPALALLVSGGHTELVWVKNWLSYKILGQTLDDAAGEAFDKVARLLGLPYPGGPEISRLAESARKKKKKHSLVFPRPMIHSRDLNFSFSGLKTAVLYALRKNPNLDASEVARAFEDAAVDVLVSKTAKAAEAKKPETIIVGGGVAANAYLRQELRRIKIKNDILYPEPAFTGDNAAMIAAAAYFHILKKDFARPAKLEARGRLSIEQKAR